VTKKTDTVIKNLKVKTNGDIYTVNVDIRHINKPAHLKGLIMVVFEENAPSLRAKAGKKLSQTEKQGSRRVTELEFELKSMRSSSRAR